MAEAHFARVVPVVGQHLRQTRVAVVGLPQAAPLVTHLAACGVGHWVWEVMSPPQSPPAGGRLIAGRDAQSSPRRGELEGGTVSGQQRPPLGPPHWEGNSMLPPPGERVIAGRDAQSSPRRGELEGGTMSGQQRPPLGPPIGREIQSSPRRGKG